MTQIPEWSDDCGEINYIELRDGTSFTAPLQGITKIEKTFKSGMYSNIPYVRVWNGDHLFAEISQHELAGVYFYPKE